MPRDTSGLPILLLIAFVPLFLIIGTQGERTKRVAEDVAELELKLTQLESKYKDLEQRTEALLKLE